MQKYGKLVVRWSGPCAAAVSEEMKVQFEEFIELTGVPPWAVILVAVNEELEPLGLQPAITIERSKGSSVTLVLRDLFERGVRAVLELAEERFAEYGMLVECAQHVGLADLPLQSRMPLRRRSEGVQPQRRAPHRAHHSFFRFA